MTDTSDALSLLVPQLAAHAPAGKTTLAASASPLAEVVMAAPMAKATAERIRRWVMLRRSDYDLLQIKMYGNFTLYRYCNIPVYSNSQ